jgi:hypothetical protein
MPMSMFENNKTTKQQGNIGVTRAIYEYARLGYDVSIPMGDCQKYDLIIDTPNGLKKVQCKTSSVKQNTNSFAVALTTRGSNMSLHTIIKRNSSDYDELFVLLSDGRCWSIPSTEINGFSSISVGGETYSKYEIDSQIKPIELIRYVDRATPDLILDSVKSVSSLQEERIKKVKMSAIDFGNFGWVTALADELNMKPQKIHSWMKRHMLDFYQTNCYKRKRLVQISDHASKGQLV